MERPRVGLGVAVLKDGKVLLGKRRNAHGEGSWSFPGGHLEFNETWEQGAMREIAEEVGITIKNLRFSTVTNDFFPKEGKHYVTIYIVADYDSGDVRVLEPDKMVDWQWFTWDELPTPLFICLENALKQGWTPFSEKYQHYKGNKYEIIAEGKDSETKEDLVVYKGLYNDPEFGLNPVWVRSKKEFHEDVEHHGETKKRFTKLR